VRRSEGDALPRRPSAIAAIAALAAVLAVDALISARPWPLPVIGVLDEIAHLLTAWLVLSAVLPARGRPLLPWALVGVVLVDVDHVPLYAWGVGAATDGGRPVTHSVGTVVLLMALSRAGRRLRTPASGFALGVLLHLLRDLFTGPGVPLLWPVIGTSVLMPYPAYAAVLG
jgi:inner membrane protein